ncbi:MAG TPA: HD domain-containing protein [Acidimicrobiales bacterium]
MTDDLVARARAFAAEAHRGDLRKGTDTPYFDGHLEPVARLVEQSGGDDVQIAAAYLHDAAEDHGGEAMLDRIRYEFGPEVAETVDHLSDSLVDTTGVEDKAPWLERKQAYLDGLASEPTRSLEVSVADKLDNGRSILEDYRAVGDEIWARFNEQRPEGQLWYYATLVGIFEQRIPDHPLTAELADVVTELAARVRADRPDLPQTGPWPRPDPV